jgi:hypothetical protein
VFIRSGPSFRALERVAVLLGAVADVTHIAAGGADPVRLTDVRLVDRTPTAQKLSA